MGQPEKLEKAELREIIFLEGNQVKDGDPGRTVTVQFNPETLTVSFSNQAVGGDQSGGGAIQYVGRGSTKLSMELWFDVTVPVKGEQMEPTGDVRELTKKVAYFITPREAGKNKWIPPGVRFLWGTFLFEGIIDSLTEKLEFWSSEGKPLRASVSVSMTSKSIQYKFNPKGNAAAGTGAGGAPAPGTQQQQQARSGDTVQSMAAANGQKDWKPVAEQNGVENPRHVPPGSSLNMTPPRR